MYCNDHDGLQACKSRRAPGQESKYVLGVYVCRIDTDFAVFESGLSRTVLKPHVCSRAPVTRENQRA